MSGSDPPPPSHTHTYTHTHTHDRYKHTLRNPKRSLNRSHAEQQRKVKQSAHADSGNDSNHDSVGKADSRVANARKNNDCSDSEDDKEAPSSSPMDGLRQRLQARIALLRKQRETDGKRGLKRGREATNGPLSAEDKEKLKQQRRKAKKLKRAEQRKQKARKDRTLGTQRGWIITAKGAARVEDDTDSTIASAPHSSSQRPTVFLNYRLKDTEDAIRKKKMIAAALNADSRGRKRSA